MTLSPRLAYQNSATIALSEDQLIARDRVRKKLLSGEYSVREVSCFCGNYEHLNIAERDRYGLPVQTVICARCGLLRSLNQLDSSSAAKFYQEDYRQLYSGHVGANGIWNEQKKRSQFYLRVVRGLLDRIQSVYEIGCGAGGLLTSFADIGKVVAGCDMGGEYLEKGLEYGLNLVNGDAKTLLKEQKGRQADLLMMIHVVEHFSDLEKELKDALKVLKPGGILLIDVPGVLAIDQVGAYHGDLLRYLQNAHNFHFTGSTIAYILRCLGLFVHYCDDSVLVIAEKPLNLSDIDNPLPVDEVRKTIRYLAELERRIYHKRQQKHLPSSSARILRASSH